METLQIIIGLLFISLIESQQYQQGQQQYQPGQQQQYQQVQQQQVQQPQGQQQQVQQQVQPQGQQQVQPQGQQQQGQPQQYQQGQPQQYQQGQPQQYQQGQQQQYQPGQNQPRQVQSQGGGQQQQIHNKNLMREKSHVQDREHIQEHLEGVIDNAKVDISKMTEEELQFHYFKMHDSDGNNQLDGTELCKSIIHWHVEESLHNKNDHPIKVFSDIELMNMIDPILRDDDSNQNGFIDYAEFIFAQQTRSATQGP